MATKRNKIRLGVFYRSNGRWTGPYAGLTLTGYTWKRNPMKSDLAILKNDVLKSRVKLIPVVG